MVTNTGYGAAETTSGWSSALWTTTQCRRRRSRVSLSLLQHDQLLEADRFPDPRSRRRQARAKQLTEDVCAPFDNSAALEILTFNGPEVREASLPRLRKRPTQFDYRMPHSKRRHAACKHAGIAEP